MTQIFLIQFTIGAVVTGLLAYINRAKVKELLDNSTPSQGAAFTIAFLLLCILWAATSYTFQGQLLARVADSVFFVILGAVVVGIIIRVSYTKPEPQAPSPEPAPQPPSPSDTEAKIDELLKQNKR